MGSVRALRRGSTAPATVGDRMTADLAVTALRDADPSPVAGGQGSEGTGADVG